MSSDLTNILTAMILSAGSLFIFFLVSVQTDPFGGLNILFSFVVPTGVWVFVAAL
jgi:hypothetical protein